MVRQVKRERAAQIYLGVSRHPDGNVIQLEADILGYVPRAEKIVRGFVKSNADTRTRTRKNLDVLERFMRELQGKAGKEFV